MNMTTGMQAATSAMQAASVRMDVTAHNIANINTPDFRDGRVEQLETAQPSTQASQARDVFERGTGTDVYGAGDAEQDLNREMVNMITNRHLQAANIATVRVQNEVSLETINLVG